MTGINGATHGNGSKGANHGYKEELVEKQEKGAKGEWYEWGHCGKKDEIFCYVDFCEIDFVK